METKVVSHGNLSVVVGEETAIVRMRRSRAKIRAAQTQSGDEDADILRVVFYPDCVAATLEYRGFTKPTFEEFIELPGEFVDNWMAAIWELIPAWDINKKEVVDEEAEEKKE